MDLSSRTEMLKPSYVDVHLINSPEVLETVSILQRLVSSCAGPAGRVHVVHNTCGGRVTFTSASGRMLSTLSISRPELKLVVSSVLSHLGQHQDGGLFMTCVSCRILQLSLQAELPLCKLRSLYEKFAQTVCHYLTSSNCAVVVKADYSDLHVLMAYVRSILSSKCLLNLSKEDLIKMSELVMRAFVESIPTATVPETRTRYSNGCMILALEQMTVPESRLMHGILLEYPDLNNCESTIKLQVQMWSNSSSGDTAHARSTHIRVALFSCSMSGDLEEVLAATYEVSRQQSECVEQSVLDRIVETCPQLERLAVGLVLCQRVIHPEVKAVLRSKGIIFVDRLGLQKIPYLQDLTGAHPIASILTPVADLENCLGQIDCLNHVVLGDQSYLHLTNSSSGVVSLVLCAPWEERLSELKVCVETCLHGLKSLVREPRLLMGGGCWQVHCGQVLTQRVLEELPSFADSCHVSQSEVLSALAMFRSALYNWTRTLASTSETVLMDLSSFHAWRVPKGREMNVSKTCLTTCCCGMLAMDTVQVEQLVPVLESTATSQETDSTSPTLYSVQDLSRVVLDSFPASVQALERAVWTVNLLLSVGVFVHDKN